MKTLLVVLFLLPQMGQVSVPLKVAQCAVAADSNLATLKQPAAYLFPEFTNGTVYFRNGTRCRARLNYHLGDGHMRFLSPSSDTLLFTGKYLIDFVQIAERRFILTDDHSDMELMGIPGRVALAARTRPEPVGNSQSHSGQHYSASEGDRPPALMVSNHGGNFQWENNASGHRWPMRTTYFLIDQNRIVHPASRRAFMAVYARHKRQLALYLRERRTDFGNLDDLQVLLDFCNTLATL